MGLTAPGGVGADAEVAGVAGGAKAAAAGTWDVEEQERMQREAVEQLEGSIDGRGAGRERAAAGGMGEGWEQDEERVLVGGKAGE
jgi:hypothetical protein